MDAGWVSILGGPTEESARPIDEKAVVTLAESIKAIGLKTPITVRPMQIVVNCQPKSGYEVVSGQHRLEAIKMLGREEIDCFITEDDETACRMWEISENLHRAELPQLERDKLVAEWCRLVGREPQMAQPAPSKPQYEKRGQREASRQLGLDRDDVRRAVKVASLAPEAQQAADGQPKACNCRPLVASGGNCWAANGLIVSNLGHYLRAQISPRAKTPDHFRSFYCILLLAPHSRNATVGP